ncbi:MAG TPA: hypothetical protein VK445_06760 [Dissulfurispiraceae bacterium]|nr:hypothetical protein [Dissulfurispiraceae bacterium]
MKGGDYYGSNEKGPGKKGRSEGPGKKGRSEEEIRIEAVFLREYPKSFANREANP